MKPVKNSDGIYIAYPGFIAHLGDYGYWQDSQWCSLGNIHDIAGNPREFSISKEQINQKVVCSRGVECINDSKLNLEAMPISAGMEIAFTNKDSFYFGGVLNEIHRFASLEGEIKPYLEKLRTQHQWKNNFWLAYAVFYSSDFISIRATDKNINIKVEAEGMPGPSSSFNFSKLASSFHKKQSGLDITKPSEGNKHFAGCKFISLTNSSFLRKEQNLKFNVYNIE